LQLFLPISLSGIGISRFGLRCSSRSVDRIRYWSWRPKCDCQGVLLGCHCLRLLLRLLLLSKLGPSLQQSQPNPTVKQERKAL
jgi:hypothetical protein